jgi:hypothetical protein
VPHPYAAPSTLGDYELVQAFDTPQGVHLLYEKGAYALSVFETKGELDADDLPRHTTHVAVGDDDAYRFDGGTVAGRVLVFERGGVVFTLVGDESSAAVLDAAHGLRGGRHTSLATRMRRGCSAVLDGLSPAS